MAPTDQQVQEPENPTADESAAPVQDETQNPATADGEDSSAAPQPDYDGRFKALEAQLQRAEQRSRQFEETARLLEQERYQRQQQSRQQSEPGLPNELLELDKTLDPIFQTRLRTVVQPLIDTTSRLYDEQDAARFEMYLMRNHPEIFDEDGGLDKVFQEVETIRRQAAQAYNQWLSRTDAFLYAQGIHGVQQQAKSRKEKKSVQVREEAKRMQTVRAAGSGVQQTAPKKAPGAEIQSIREKAARGERLSDSERAKYRDFIAGVSF